MTPRLLIVDDHPLMRLGLSLALDQTQRFQVCGTAATVEEARKLCAEHRPDFLILDLTLGGRDGIELVEELHDLHPEGRILVYTSLDERIYAKAALRAGARGFLMKSADFDVVIDRLDTVGRGGYGVSDALVHATMNSVVNRPAPSASPLSDLSDRELQVFRLLGTGRTTAQIADDIHLSIKTVGTYRERLKLKLGYETGTELEAAAVAHARTGRLLAPHLAA